MVHLSRDQVPPEDVQFLSSESDTDVEPQSTEKIRKLEALEAPIPLDNKFSCSVIIAGLPITTEEKFEKLISAVTRKIELLLVEQNVVSAEQVQAGDLFEIELISEAGPDGAKRTVGVAFVTFKDEFIAKQASKLLGGTGMGTMHPFRPCLVDDFDYVVHGGAASEETAEEEDDEAAEDAEERDIAAEAAGAEIDYDAAPKNAKYNRYTDRDWLADPLCREQYVIRCDAATRVFWHDSTTRSAEPAVSPKARLGLAVCWSPKGSYLATFHRKGIWLRSGPLFKKRVCFNHEKVRRLQFSPNEEFLLTWNGAPCQSGHDRAAIIWNVLTGKRIRAFPTPSRAADGTETENGGWPFFLFSPDSKYLAMRREKDIVVYELPAMAVLEVEGGRKKPLSYPLEQFCWSPTANRLAVWVPESGDSPGKLLLVDIPSRQEVASKNVFGVRQLSIHWQENGELLALRSVISRKKGKKTKSETTQLEILRVTDRNVPVDTIAIPECHVKLVVWERGPKAARLVVLVVDSSNQHTFHFYRVHPLTAAKKDTELVATLNVSASVNCFEWSPEGRNFVIAAKGSEGFLLFGALTDDDQVDIAHRDEHQDLTEVCWDPSGRFVTTACLVTAAEAAYRCGGSAGYRIYTFNGQLQVAKNAEGASQFLWRPRPKSLLSAAERESVVKRLKEYTKKFHAEEELRRSKFKATRKAETDKRKAEFWAKVDAARLKYESDPDFQTWRQYEQNYRKIMQFEEIVETWEEPISVEKIKIDSEATAL